MKTALAVLLVSLLPATALAAEVPVYDSAKFCKKLAQDSDEGSYTVESGCMDMEKEAKATLAGMAIEPKILKFCAKLAREDDGGNYTTLLGCVEMEQEAKAELGK